MIGAIGGAASFGIGEMALGIGQGLTSSGQWLAQTSFQMGAHAILGGYMNVFMGGEFGAGALSGAFGSVFGGTTNSLLKNAGGFLRVAGTTFSGAMSGGFGSVMAGGNFWEGARNGAISAGLNHAAHIILQTKPNWNKLTDEEKIEQILNSLRSGSENKSGHLDMHKIFKNFPTNMGGSMGNTIMGNFYIDGNPIDIYMDIAYYKDMRFSLNGQIKQTFPAGNRKGVYTQITYGAYRGYYLNRPLPIFSIQTQTNNFNNLYNYIKFK